MGLVYQADFQHGGKRWAVLREGPFRSIREYQGDVLLAYAVGTEQALRACEAIPQGLVRAAFAALPRAERTRRYDVGGAEKRKSSEQSQQHQRAYDRARKRSRHDVQGCKAPAAPGTPDPAAAPAAKEVARWPSS